MQRNSIKPAKGTIFICAMTQMNLDDTALHEAASHKRTNAAWFHPHKVPRDIRWTEIRKNGFCWGLTAENREWGSAELGVPPREDQEILETDGSEGCTVCLMSFIHSVQNGHHGTFHNMWMLPHLHGKGPNSMTACEDAALGTGQRQGRGCVCMFAPDWLRSPAGLMVTVNRGNQRQRW